MGDLWNLAVCHEVVELASVADLRRTKPRSDNARKPQTIRWSGAFVGQDVL